MPGPFPDSPLLRVACASAVMWLVGCAPGGPAGGNEEPGLEAPRTGLTLHVSPDGNDAWSGFPAAPDADRTDGPLATIQRARDLIRESRSATNAAGQGATVLLRGGVYRQRESLVFTAADSGTPEHPVTYRAYRGEKPVISGGDVIRGWHRDQGNLWRASVPPLPDGRPWRFNQLYVNGGRRTRARLPNRGAFLRSDGPIAKDNPRGFYFKPGDLQEWEDMRGAIFVVYHSWETSIHHVRSMDTGACQVTFIEPAPWGMGRWEKQQRYYVENVFAALDAPGEWYLNETENSVYYYPLPGEKVERAEIVAPVLASTLVRFAGDATKGDLVEHLAFRGIAFMHANADLRRVRNPGQGEIYQPALIMATGLRHSSFEDCEVAHTGAHGIWMAAGCEGNIIRRCHIHDLNGGGVYIGGGWGVQDAAPARNIVVDNNFIHDGSHLFHGAHGVWIGTSSSNAVTHNEIKNFDYSGISCGWSWGFQPSSANHNALDYNHIHHLGNGDGLSDMGGIYTLGISPGTTERGNHIHHVFSYAHVSHGSGIYPDEGSSEILIEDNVVHRVRTCPLFQHYGTNNVVRNNILAFGGEGQLQRCREDKPCHYVAEGNIVYADIAQMLGGVWKNGDWKLGSNVYWSTAGEPRFKDLDFAAWRAKGHDAGSVVADPKFADAARGDFRLRRDSPALELGFRPIDVAKAGLYGDRAWVTLPRRYPDRPLNEIPAPVEPPFVVNFDFEADDAGAPPLEGEILQSGAQSLMISSETAAGGKQSLKFIDAPGKPHSWTPHLYYRPTCASGEYQLSWDMRNTRAAPASFYLEARQWDSDPYLVGPTVSVAADGKVTAGKQPIGTIPLDEWVHVDIRFRLGEGSPTSFRVTLAPADREPIVAEIPYPSPKFERVTWFGISSTSDAAAVFYLDNLRLGTAEELARPPSRRPATRPAKARPSHPANPDALAGYWKFDGPDGYVAKDSSGCRNEGEVWASWAKGAFGSAIFCDPAASRVSVPDDPTLQFGGGDFSIALWICPTQLAIDSKDPRRRFMSKDSPARSTWWNLNITTEGRPFLEMRDSNQAICANRPKGTLPENSWTHLAIVVDRAKRKVRYYLNGAADSATDIPENFTGSLDVAGGDLSIGGGWQPFIGLLDEVKIHRRALTDAEVQADYAREKANRTSAKYELVE